MWPKKMIFARPDFSTFLVFCSGDLSDDESEEKHSVAICGGSTCILTGLYPNAMKVFVILITIKVDPRVLFT